SILLGPAVLLTSGSPGTNPRRLPLPLVGLLGGRDLVPVCFKSIPTIRGPGESTDRDLDSTLWVGLSSGQPGAPPGGS
ncbi:unnamed protein product, partial [Staurois parvus]